MAIRHLGGPAFLGLLCWLMQTTVAIGEDPAPARQRLRWDSSRVVGSPEPPLPYETERIFPDLSIQQPLSFDAEPGRASYLVIQHLGSWAPPGRILRIEDRPDAREAQVLIELKGIAYELAFHPNYLENGYLFVGQNLTDGGETKTRVSRFTVSRDPPHAIDPASEVVVIEWPSNGHNGGAVDFGGDGMLYVTSGDGTSDSDRDLRGQDMSELTSKVLRIDVDHPEAGRNYSVPADNPFVGREGIRPETWAYGLRNPWRMTYDALSDQLWVGNNGQDLWETAHLIRRGENYGWSVTEGSHPFYPSRGVGPTPIVPPTVEHHHSEARSLTGGVVYRGAVHPELEGAYVYGDWSTGKIWGVKHDGQRNVWHRELADTPFQITGFGLSREGELVVIDHQTGFHRLVRSSATSEQVSRFPRKLSETGLYVSVADRVPHPGLVPYSVNAPLWSDGALKTRYIAIPGDGRIDFKDGTQGWDFPEGTVLVKEFSLEFEAGRPESRRPIETRLMTRQQGEWVGYSYEWDEEGRDAVLVGKEGRDRTFTVADPTVSGGERTQTWRYPSRAECMVCHSRAANFVLGLSAAQMNRDHDHGQGPVNQLAEFERIGLFKEVLPQPPERLARLADPADPSAAVGDRARAYLHSNCAGCHVEAGGGNAAINLSVSVEVEQMGLIDVEPRHDRLGAGPRARLIAPGDPDRSVLWLRLGRRGSGQMPPLATSRPDPDGVALIRQWVQELGEAQRFGTN